MIVLGMMVVTAFVSTLSGLWGVLVMDLFQFALKMGMVIVLAVCAVRAVGGMEALKQKLQALDAARAAAGGGGGSILSFVPDIGSAWMPMLTFFVYVAVSWWATWYPGAEPGGGGFVAQRIFCAKDEKHSLLATLWFNVAHYAVRPWPWILTALASLVLYPDLADKESGFVKTIVDPAVFPVALRGVMVAAFAAAYMSTVGTQLNWGASYLVNDFYRRFLVRGAGERHYVRASQVATVLVMLASCVVTWLPGLDRRRVEAPDRGGGGDRQRLHPPVVLVADQCLERGLGDGRLVRGVAPPAARAGAAQRGPARVRVDRADHGRRLDRGLAVRDLPDAAGARGDAARLLPSGSAERGAVGAHRRSRDRRRARPGRAPQPRWTGRRAACSSTRASSAWARSSSARPPSASACWPLAAAAGGLIYRDLDRRGWKTVVE